MVVSHNVPALFSHLSMRRADRGLGQAMQRLSTGTRINSAREDAAGLAIANKLSFQVGGLERASENATHGIALIQTAEGAMTEIHSMLQRKRELAVQAANDTLTNQQKGMIQYEVDQLINEIQQISTRTEYNRMRILNGEADRVTEHRTRGAATSTPNAGTVRDITTTLFVSPAVQPGSLNYTIEQVGRQAVVGFAGNPPWVDGLGGFAPAGTMSINGISVEVSENTPWNDVGRLVNEALQFAGIQLQTNTVGNASFLVSNIAGSDQHITITGSTDLITAMNLVPNATDPARFGTDAIVRVGAYPNGLFDSSGNAVPGSDALAVSAEGNKVFIRGSQGEDIRLNLQVAFDPDVAGGGFTIGGIPVPATGIVPPGDSHMTLDLRNFGPLMLQVGPSHNTAIPVQIPRMNAETLGLVEFVAGRQINKMNFSNTEGAVRSLGVIDRAIDTVSSVRSRLGAYQNRLESTVRSLDVAAENTESSRSRIQDTDMARESTRFAQYNVMYQAAMSILGQANQRPQQLISLLQ